MDRLDWWVGVGLRGKSLDSWGWKLVGVPIFFRFPQHVVWCLATNFISGENGLEVLECDMCHLTQHFR